jgi:hypothetical protein
MWLIVSTNYACHFIASLAGITVKRICQIFRDIGGKEFSSAEALDILKKLLNS